MDERSDSAGPNHAGYGLTNSGSQETQRSLSAATDFRSRVIVSASASKLVNLPAVAKSHCFRPLPTLACSSAPNRA
jgi:hypothetical protein